MKLTPVQADLSAPLPQHSPRDPIHLDYSVNDCPRPRSAQLTQPYGAALSEALCKMTGLRRVTS